RGSGEREAGIGLGGDALHGEDSATRRGSVGEVYRDSYTKNEWVNDSGNYPRSVLKFKSERNHGHPTQKPQALAEYLIRTFSNRGDVVLDHCYGSGTTGAAAMGTGRSFIGVERDPMWFQKGRARILAAAGGGERPSPTTPVAANDVLPKIEQVPVALDGLMATEGLRLPAAPAQRLVNKCDARVEEVGALKVVDLFCGAGGLSLGFELASHEVVAAFDFWNRAVETYRLNFDHPVFELDLTDVALAVNAIRPYAPDLIAGGPPCQEFSSAGSRSEGGKANLTRTFAEIVSAIRPRMFVMENVGRASSSVAYRAAREIFKSAGYGLTERVLDASLCGVPQKRKRFFCIGILDGEDGVLNAFLDESFASQAMTVRDYMGSEIDFDHYYRHPRNYARRAVFSVDEPSPTIRGVNRPVPKTHKRHAGDTEHPAKVEALTQEHRARIQTFPVGFQWAGCKTEQDQMIGNAVPVELGRYIAKAISRYATHPVAALTDGHRIIGIEQSAAYCQMAGERLAAGQYGTGLNDNGAGHSVQQELIEDAA
ncbi:DNA (cytosine-5-)-methyltransferase, partial [Brevundimonas sp. P7753]|uniref:DNA (cytosine-5-)-methyltransferase n=1 Tax=Brevundimonas sp. P7753 TaxID=2726982 RepID=UPI0015B83251